MAVRLARRSFLSQLSLAGLASCLRLDRIVAGTYSSMDAQAPGDPKLAASIRTLPSPGVFELLPLGSIRPSGWLKNQLRIQADGLSGHLGETWADVGPNSGWRGGAGESWERGPYYMDGLLPLAYLLEDERLKATAQRFIDWTLEHQAPNGM